VNNLFTAAPNGQSENSYSLLIRSWPEEVLIDHRCRGMVLQQV
jgi:hypothetical protein